MTPEQKGRLLEWIASIIHHDLSSDGFHDLIVGHGMDADAAHAMARTERDRLLRRAAKLLGEEASTRIAFSE